jgi:hypothetical protein
LKISADKNKSSPQVQTATSFTKKINSNEQNFVMQRYEKKIKQKKNIKFLTLKTFN